MRRTTIRGVMASTSHYDGGLRVPFMMRWPGHIKPGSRCDYQGLNFDLFPTFLELAGEAPPELDAVSLVPLLKGGTIDQPRDLYFVRREGGPAYGGKSYEALIRGDWKLMQNDPYSPLELYNLKNDPQEKEQPRHQGAQGLQGTLHRPQPTHPAWRRHAMAEAVKSKSSALPPPGSFVILRHVRLFRSLQRSPCRHPA
jgi:arylsulfatase A-like enzyme